MRIFYVILLLVAIIAAVIFAGQNSVPVTVTFFGLTANASMSVVLVITFAAGILLGMLLLLPSVWKRMRALSVQKKKARAFENQLKNAGSAAEQPKPPALSEAVPDAQPAQSETSETKDAAQ